MQGIRAKISRLLYPFNQPLHVVLCGNNSLHVQHIYDLVQKAMHAQSGALAEIRSLVTGIENAGTSQQILYFHNGDLSNLVKFTLNFVSSIDELNELNASMQIDVLMVCMSFSDTEPHVHDESVKYEMAPLISNSSWHKCRKVFILEVNQTLFNDDVVPDVSLLADLTQSVADRDFTKVSRQLNTKGIQQLPLASNYLQSYYPRLNRLKRFKNQLGVVMKVNDKLVNDDIVLLVLYTSLLEHDYFSRSTINQYS